MLLFLSNQIFHLPWCCITRETKTINDMANINIKFEIITNVAVFWYKKDLYNLCGLSEQVQIVGDKVKAVREAMKKQVDK